MRGTPDQLEVSRRDSSGYTVVSMIEDGHQFIAQLSRPPFG